MNCWTAAADETWKGGGGVVVKIIQLKISELLFMLVLKKSILFKTYESMHTPLTAPPPPTVKSIETKLYWKHPNYA